MIAYVAALLLAASAAGPAAAAASQPLTTTYVQLRGSLTVSWSGDPSDGCAAQGVCGVTGSLQMVPTSTSGESSSSPEPSLPPLELTDEAAVARVVQTAAGGSTPAACADVVPVDFDLAVSSRDGTLRATVNRIESFELPSSGRCAGPTQADMVALTLPARRLHDGYDLSGQATFRAGPFAVAVTSTVRALVSDRPPAGPATVLVAGAGSRVTVVAPPPGRSELLENAQLTYRVTSIRGGLSQSFTALAAPLCEPLGACGTGGELSESFSGGGVFGFSGTRVVTRRVGKRAALADLAAGRLNLEALQQAASFPSTVRETLIEPGGTTCTDAASQPASLSGAGTRHGRTVTLSLSPSGLLQGPSGAVDPLRTRCPGPSRADVLGPQGGALATATLPASDLGRRRLTLTFQHPGAFQGSAYDGQRGGSVVLTLRLTGTSGGTARLEVPGS